MKRNKIISLVGGGWSFNQVRRRDALPGFIIAANEGGVLLPKVDAIVTMDRLWTENRWAQLSALKIPTHIRRSALQNITVTGDEDWLRPFDNDHTTVNFSRNAGSLNGTNSGVCALNLAWQMEPQELYLFGFDMCRDAKGKAYWHEPYAWAPPKGATSNGKYVEWAAQFNTIALAFRSIGTNVFNVSKGSKIICWPKIEPSEIGI